MLSAERLRTTVPRPVVYSRDLLGDQINEIYKIELGEWDMKKQGEGEILGRHRFFEEDQTRMQRSALHTTDQTLKMPGSFPQYVGPNQKHPVRIIENGEYFRARMIGITPGIP